MRRLTVGVTGEALGSPTRFAAPQPFVREKRLLVEFWTPGERLHTEHRLSGSPAPTSAVVFLVKLEMRDERERCDDQ
jgi:hypothetical protein